MDDKLLKAMVQLRAKHTAPKPSVALAKALVLLKANDASGAVPFLTWVYTPAGDNVLDAKTNYAPQTVRLVDLKLDAAATKRFADDVLLNVASAPNYRLLAPLIIQWLTPDVLFSKLIGALKGDNWLHIHNALELPYDVLGRVQDYAFSAAQEAELRELAASFAELPTAPELVRDAASDFVLAA